MALERGTRGTLLAVGADDLDRALCELLLSGGELTRNFLGFLRRSSAG